MRITYSKEEFLLVEMAKTDQKWKGTPGEGPHLNGRFSFMRPAGTAHMHMTSVLLPSCSKLHSIHVINISHS